METSKKLNGETLFDLTSYVAATPASLSQQQANATAQTTHDTFGLGSEKPLASYDQNTQSWKMYEDTFLLDSTLFSGKWPASGMTLSGRLFPQPQLVRRIVEIASSSWPTPRNSSAMSEDMETIRERLDNGKPYKSRLEEAIALAPTPSGNWQTPTVSDIYADNLKSSQQIDGSMHSVSLGQAVQMWPTPTAVTRPMEGNVRAYRAKIQAGEMTELDAEAILGKSVWKAQGKIPEMWPTPRSNTAMASLITPEIANDPKRFPNLETVVGRREEVTGRLNPMWVEWLMGFPLGWTDLED